MMIVHIVDMNMTFTVNMNKNNFQNRCGLQNKKIKAKKGFDEITDKKFFDNSMHCIFELFVY